MNRRVTYGMLVLFFAGLGVLWWADATRMKTDQERRRLTGRVLPELSEADMGDIRRLEISGGPEPLGFVRGPDGRWRLDRPIEARASQATVEDLLSSLKLLRRLPDARGLSGEMERYGLETPVRTIRVYGPDGQAPLSTLEVGKRFQDRRYVRAPGSPEAEVVEAAPLEAVERSSADWREPALFTVPGFEVEGIEVRGDGRTLELRRIGGRWRVVRPFASPADLTNVDHLIAGLLALRADGEGRGFAAQGVRDWKPFGLDGGALVITVKPSPGRGDRRPRPSAAGPRD